jgi:hypothetical protein
MPDSRSKLSQSAAATSSRSDGGNSKTSVNNAEESPLITDSIVALDHPQGAISGANVLYNPQLTDANRFPESDQLTRSQ